MPTVYDLGDIATLTAEFEVVGEDTDPTTVSVVVKKPDLTTTTYTDSSSPPVTKVSTGKYSLDIEVDQPGDWAFRFIGTGTASDQAQGTFYVNQDDTAWTKSYITVNALKSTLGMNTTGYADADLARSIRSSSRTVDSLCGGRRFYLDAEDTDRYFTPRSPLICPIDDLVSVTAVASDTSGDGTFSLDWTENTDYVLEPLNAFADDRPQTILRVHPRNGNTWPSWWPRSVKVTGRFGWPTVPDNIADATRILAAQLLTRSRDANFGILGLGTDAAMRIAREDPQVTMLLTDYVRLQAG